jgi:hypothetical protein
VMGLCMTPSNLGFVLFFTWDPENLGVVQRAYKIC